jgi:chromatin remodeling complex protein RSC6
MSLSNEEIIIETHAVDQESPFDAIQQNLTKFKTNITELQQQLRTLEKSLKKEIKKEPKKMETVSKPPMKQLKIIGFDLPEKITAELGAFMQLTESTSTRNAVTSFITEYIRANKLQDMTDRKCIHPDAALSTLFKMTENAPLTYFNLHKYISGLFIR